MTTLKQERLIAGITDKHNIGKTVQDIAKEAGYSDSYASSLVYRDIRKDKIASRIAKAYNPEQVKADILKAEKDFAKDKDNSNRARMLELRAKVLGLTKEQSNTQVSVFTGDMIKDLPPIDIEPSQEGAKPSNDVSH